jgi:hypothetical protein
MWSCAKKMNRVKPQGRQKERHDEGVWRFFLSASSIWLLIFGLAKKQCLFFQAGCVQREYEALHGMSCLEVP